MALLTQDDEAFRKAGLFFTIFMGMALLSGFVYLVALHEIMKPIMRGSAVWVMTASLVLALGAMYVIWKKKRAFAGVLLFLSLLAMVVLRHQVRLILLEDTFSPARLTVQSDWTLIGLFLACFVIGLALCGWMVALFGGHTKAAES